MKTVQILCLFLLITYITCTCQYKVTEYSEDNCKNDNTREGYCCYYEAPKKTKGSKGCLSLSKYQYDHIKVYADYYKVFGGDNYDTKDKDAKIKCKSNYLQISIIILILLFL